jgi:hypothetical protein
MGSLAVGWVLIPSMGIVGAAWALLPVDVLMIFIVLPASLRQLHESYAEFISGIFSFFGSARTPGRLAEEV